MKAKGCDVVLFGAGEPDFPTPDEISVAAIASLASGKTKYTASVGIPELREAVAEKCLRENKLSVQPNQVVASCGAKHSLFNAMWVTVSPGDEVILIAPYWMTYRDQVQLVGGVVRVVHTSVEEGYVPSVEAIRAAITPKTKAIVVNSPCNPTGAVFPPEVLAGIAELALEHNLWVISDEIYERLLYDAQHLTIASLSPEIAARTITILGVSKTYAMTGWRIGFAVSPAPVAAAMGRFQDQVTSNATTISQYAAIQALKMTDTEFAKMHTEFAARRELMGAELAKISGLKFSKPAGAFYYFVDVSGCLKDGETDTDLADRILEDAQVAVVPGSVFEAPGCLRLSYTASQHDIERGIQRIAATLNS